MQQTSLKAAPLEIAQEDNTHFSIRWSDGKKFTYKLSHLQFYCPCASCRDELTGKRRASAKAVDEDVRALHIEGVGSYGLKISFKNGCSQGIYSYHYLYRMGEAEAWKDGECVNYFG